MAERFFLDRDNSGHWYVIPVKHRQEWNDFCNIPDDDERCWNVPEWAEQLVGPPSYLSFENPKEDSHEA